MTIKEFKVQYALGTISLNDKLDIVRTTTSKRILTILSRDKDWGVRYQVVWNKNTPTEVFEELRWDKDKHIRSVCELFSLNLTIDIKH